MPGPSRLQVTQCPRLQLLWVSFLPPTLPPVRPEALRAILKAHIQGTSRAWTWGPGTVTSVQAEACQGLLTPSILAPSPSLAIPTTEKRRAKGRPDMTRGLCLLSSSPCHQRCGAVEPRLVSSLRHHGQEPQAEQPKCAPRESAARKQAPEKASVLPSPLGTQVLAPTWPPPASGLSAAVLANPATRAYLGRTLWLASWAAGHLSPAHRLLQAAFNQCPLISSCGPPLAACWATSRPEAAGPVWPARHPLTRSQPPDTHPC